MIVFILTHNSLIFPEIIIVNLLIRSYTDEVKTKKSKKSISPLTRIPLLSSAQSFFGQFRVTEWLLLALIVVLSTKPLQDPDFGWHFRAGQDFLKTFSWPKTDPYSYTMPDWPWVNHEWLSQVFTVVVQFLVGNLGLSLVFGMLLTVVFLWAGAATSKTAVPFRLMASLIALLAALPILGVRMQMFTLLGMVFVLWAFYQYREGRFKSLWWVPLVFILWTNLHGGFPIGIAILGLLGGGEVLKLLAYRWWPRVKNWVSEATLSWAQIWHLALITLLSGLATLVNPYGWGLHHEIYLALTNDYMYENISEWQPVSLDNAISYNYIIYLVIFFILLIFSYRKLEPTRLLVAGVFLGLSLMHWRNMPFFMIMSVGFLAEFIEYNTHSVLKALTASKWFLLILTLVSGMLLGRHMVGLINTTIDPELAFRTSQYPIDAINWAKAHPDQIGTRMFNDYGWGGLLLWQFPQQKVFIDGRMPHWRLPAGPGQKEERWIFKDHNLLSSVEPGSLEILNKYQVNWAMINTNGPLYWVLLGQPGWSLRYQDTAASVFVKS